MAFLQPVTRNLPSFARDPIIALIGQECYTTLIYNTDFTSEKCIRYSVSKGLGLGIVAGGAIVKVPQILKIVSGKSARGLSLSSYVLDTTSLIITVGYNLRNGFPWSTYGENVFLLGQNIIITSLIVVFSSSPTRYLLLTLIAAAFSFAGFALASPELSASHLQLLAAFCIPLSLFSKIPQIISNARLGSTGQLSAFLVFNSLAGCLARVYTTSTETKDPVLWWGFFLGAVLNGVLALQMAAYWKEGNTREVSVPAEKKKLEDLVEKRKVEVVSSPAAIAPEKKAAISSSSSASPRPNSPLSGRKYVRKLD